MIRRKMIIHIWKYDQGLFIRLYPFCLFIANSDYPHPNYKQLWINWVISTKLSDN